MAANEDNTTVEQLRSNIEQTRAHMSDALGALQEKLSPSALADQAQATARSAAQGAMTAIQERIDPHAIADQVSGVVREVTNRSVTTMVNSAQDAAKNAGSSLLDRVRHNPLPLALIGVGVGLLVAQEPLRRAQNQAAPVAQHAQDAMGQLAGQAQDAAGQLAGRAQDAAGQMAGQAQDTAEQLAGRVQDATGHLAGQARTQVEHAGSWLQTTVRENPVAVGAGILALGAMVGLMLPETSQENQVMGKARDAFVGRAQTAAQTVAQDTVQKAQRVAEETQAAAQRAAREQGLLPQ